MKNLTLKKRVFLYLNFLISFGVSSQNLVTNPGFEIINSKKLTSKTVDIFHDYGVKGWVNPTQASPDCFVKGKSMYYVGGKDSIIDSIQPFSGIVFAGFLAALQITDEPREYIEGSLVQDLDSGAVYRFSMKIARRDSYSDYGIDTLGIYFSEDSVRENTHSVITTIEPQVKVCVKNICVEPDVWQEISGYYTAVGNERHFVVGNFNILAKGNPGEGTQVEINNDNVLIPANRQVLVCYYFIDDITLTRVER